jgi:hypothetical protein
MKISDIIQKGELKDNGIKLIEDLIEENSDLQDQLVKARDAIAFERLSTWGYDFIYYKKDALDSRIKDKLDYNRIVNKKIENILKSKDSFFKRAKAFKELKELLNIKL